MRMISAALALAALPLAAQADLVHSTITPGNSLTEAPAAWLGATPHLVIMGHVNGYDFDVQYPDLAKAELHDLEVKREYLIDGDARPYQEIDFGIQAIIDGAAKQIEAKLNHADFNTLAAIPATLALGAEENPQGDRVFTEFEFEWEIDGVSVNEEHGDWTGMAVLAHDDAFGTAPSDAGLTGGYINATHGDDHIVISFTFEIDEAEIEE